MQFSVEKKLEEMPQEQRLNELEQMIAEKMVKEFGGSIESAFSFADGDLSGAIDAAEFRVLLRRLDVQVSDELIDALMRRYDDDENHAISAVEFELRYRFQRDRFLQFLQQRQDEKELLLSTPYTMFFFVVFVVLLYVRDLTPLMFTIGSGFAATIFNVPSESSGVAFGDIQVVPDFYEWVEEVLIPQTMVQSSQFLDGIPLVRDEWGRVSVYGHVMGTGLVFEQTRSTEEECAMEMANVSGVRCYTRGTSTDDFGVPACDPAWPPNASCYDAAWLPDDAARAAVDAAFRHNDAVGGALFKLNVSKSADWNLDVFEALKARRWMDPQTRRVSIRLATHNGEVSVYSFAKFDLELIAGGYLLPEIPRVHNIRSAVYEEAWLYGLEGLWLFLVVLNAITEFKEMAQAARENGGSCMEYFTEDGWNYVDWIQIMLAIASSVFFFTIVYDTSTLTAEYAASDGVAVPLDDPEPLLAHLASLLDDLVVYRGIALFNMVILLLRFFKAFRGQPRLAVITRTFVIAGVDISHFMIIFFCILMAFVAAAVFLFGQHVARYHEWWKALGWCFWSLTGEFFWEEVHLENPTWALIWWWSYLLVMYMVLTNMFIAMVIDAFNAANAEQASKISMVQQVVDLCKTAAATRKGGVTLDALIAMLENEEGGDGDDKGSGKTKQTGGRLDTVAPAGDPEARLLADEAKSPDPATHGRGSGSGGSHVGAGGGYGGGDSGEAREGAEEGEGGLSNQKLVSLIEIIAAWRKAVVEEEGEVTPVAEATTQTYTISLLQDFCAWNALEDEEMRGILEKNALVKLMEMDALFDPVLRRMSHIADGARELTGEAAHIAGEDSDDDAVHAVETQLDDL